MNKKRKLPAAQPRASKMPRHNDACESCELGGDLLCCGGCNLVYHLGCLVPPLTAVPSGRWLCDMCQASSGPRRRLNLPVYQGVLVKCPSPLGPRQPS